MNIKAIREKYKLSQEKFAQKLGVTAMTVRRWESGKSKPSPLALKELKKLQEEV